MENLIEYICYKENQFRAHRVNVTHKNGQCHRCLTRFPVFYLSEGNVTLINADTQKLVIAS